MPQCPHCHQAVDTQAITCPHCRCLLKAHGHPGIPLYRAEDAEFLCQTCRYQADDTCNFPQRPYAKECTMYRLDQGPDAPSAKAAYKPHRPWTQYAGWLVFIALVAIAILLAL